MEPPKVKCSECKKIMVEQFEKEPPHYLEGWSCDCGNSEKAILREKWFKKEHYGDKTRSS